MSAFSVDARGLKKLERDLGRAKMSAFPYARREFVNAQAFDSQGMWKADLPGKMKLRSQFTARSIQVEKAKLNGPARVGSVADYMATQEQGAVEAKRGAYGVPIPAAAPGKRKTRGKISTAKQFGKIRIRSSQKKSLGSLGRGVRKQALMRIAATGGGYVFLDLGPRQGIYHVRQGAKRLLVRKVWDLTKDAVSIPKNPTMQPSVADAMKSNDERWRKALMFQLRRHKVFGY